MFGVIFIRLKLIRQKEYYEGKFRKLSIAVWKSFLVRTIILYSLYPTTLIAENDFWWAM